MTGGPTHSLSAHLLPRGKCGGGFSSSLALAAAYAQPRFPVDVAHLSPASVGEPFHSLIRPRPAADPEPAGFRRPSGPTALASVDARRPALQRAANSPAASAAGGFPGKLRVLDLFSGSGGMSLGLERTGGFETVAFCEIEPFARGILSNHWPEVPCLENVATADFEPLGPVDLVTAGFPCQDISFAGKGAGLSGDRSGLFWHILRAVCLVGQPRILLENVAGLLVRGAPEVFGALAEIGHDATWHCIPASAVGAPHNRDRLWIVTDPQRDEQRGQEPRVGPFGRMGRIKQSLAWDTHWETALSALRGMDDGLSRSVDRTDLMRNAVVPQVVTEIGRAILQARAAA